MTQIIRKALGRNNILTAIFLSASLLFFCKTTAAQESSSENMTVSEEAVQESVPEETPQEMVDETKETYQEILKQSMPDTPEEKPAPVNAKAARKQAKIDEANAKKQAKKDAIEAKKETARQAKQAKIDAKEAKMGTKSGKVQAAQKAKEEKLKAAQEAKQVKIDDANAKKQAKIDAEKAKKQAKIDAQNAKLQAKLDKKASKKETISSKKQAQLDKATELKEIAEMKRQVKLDKKEEMVKAKKQARSLAAAAPIVYQSSDIPCSALPTRAKREACLWSLVQNDAATADVCKQLKDGKSRFMDKCFTKLALATKDDIYCREIAGTQERFSCYHQVMFSSVRDMSVCLPMREAKAENNVEGYMFGACVTGVAKATENVAICDQISDDEFYTNWFNCNVEVLRKSKNPRGCERITKRKKPFSAHGDFTVKACRNHVEKVN